MLACVRSDWTLSAPVLMTGLVALGVVVLARWVRQQPAFAGRSAFSLMHVAGLWWLATAALELSVHHQGCKMFLSAMAWPAILGVPTFWAVFLWQYVNSDRRPLRRSRIVMLSVMPTAFWLMALSNPWHELFYGPASAPISLEPGSPIRYDHGVLFYLAAAYGYPLMLFCIGVTLKALRLSKELYRRHYLFFLILSTIPWAANISYVTLGWTLFGFDPTPFSFALSLAGFGWLISGMRLFDLMPVARHLLLDALIDPVLFVDPRGRVIEANPAALRLARLDRRWHGRPLADWPLIGQPLSDMLGQGTEASPQLLIIEAQDQYFEIRARTISRTSRDGDVMLGQMLYLRDVTEYQRSQSLLAEALATSKQQLETISNLHDTLRQQALRDPLTGLYNRRYLEEFFIRERARCERDGTSIALAMVDLDHFKQLNDRYGHPVGDDALKGVAQFLLDGLRSTDTVFRVGGEEFLVILPSTSPGEALEKLEQLCRTLAAKALDSRAGPLQVTMSVGVAHFPAQGCSLESLMQHADAQLYHAKRSGRNRVAAAPA